MSDNPFGELPPSNPYASPFSPGSPMVWGNPLQIPAIVLLILASLTVLIIVASIPGQLIRMRAIDSSTSAGMGELAGAMVSLVVWPLMNVMIAFGAISMIRLRNHSAAYAGAILAVIPICSPCFVLGIPFGVWALVVLNRPEVKQRFV